MATKIGPGTALPASPRLFGRRKCLPGKEKKPTSVAHSNRAPSKERRLRYLPGGILSFRRKANERRRSSRAALPFLQSYICCFSPPDSTSRAVKTNVSEEIERRGAWTALLLCFRLAGSTEHTERNERWRNAQEKTPLRAGSIRLISNRNRPSKMEITNGPEKSSPSAVLA